MLRNARLLVKKAIVRLANVPQDPILVVGCGHSGTSLMLAMLDSHSRIYGVPYETSIYLRKSTAVEIEYQWCLWQQQARRKGKARCAEKTPSHIECLDWIFEVSPGAKVIAMLRDGRDVACSIKARKGNIDVGVQRWIDSCSVLWSYRDDERVRIVKLEELTAEPEASMQEVLRFVGEEYEPGVLNYHKTERRYYSKKIKKAQDATGGANHRQHRNWQINQPLMKSTVRWPRELTADEKQRCRVLDPYLQKFGYLAASD